MTPRPLERIALVAGGDSLRHCRAQRSGGIQLYTRDNASHCGGGLGRIAPVFGLYLTLAVALLATLVALIFTLIVAFTQKRWAWGAGLALSTAAATLIAVGSGSQVSSTLVGAVLGVGCSWLYPQTAQSFMPLVVAAPALACMSYTSLVRASLRSARAGPSFGMRRSDKATRARRGKRDDTGRGRHERRGG